MTGNNKQFLTTCPCPVRDYHQNKTQSIFALHCFECVRFIPLDEEGRVVMLVVWCFVLNSQVWNSDHWGVLPALCLLGLLKVPKQIGDPRPRPRRTHQILQIDDNYWRWPFRILCILPSPDSHEILHFRIWCCPVSPKALTLHPLFLAGMQQL